jgi:hypothetical protein
MKEIRMTNPTTVLHKQNGQARADMRMHEKGIAQIHLIHDFGIDASKFIHEQYDADFIVGQVLNQRAALRLDNKLNDAAGNLVGKLDLKALGISDAHVKEIEALKAAEQTPVIGDHTAAIQKAKAALVSDEGYGGHGGR